MCVLCVRTCASAGAHTSMSLPPCSSMCILCVRACAPLLTCLRAAMYLCAVCMWSHVLPCTVSDNRGRSQLHQRTRESRAQGCRHLLHPLHYLARVGFSLGNGRHEGAACTRPGRETARVSRTPVPQPHRRAGAQTNQLRAQGAALHPVTAEPALGLQPRVPIPTRLKGQESPLTGDRLAR